MSGGAHRAVSQVNCYGKVVGYKAGLTSPAVQRRFNHPTPVLMPPKPATSAKAVYEGLPGTPTVSVRFTGS